MPLAFAAILILGLGLTHGTTLAAFLALSALHFAIDDVSVEMRWAERVAGGLRPIMPPALFHDEALSQHFATLSTPVGGDALTGVASFLSLPVLALTLLAVVLRLRDRDRTSALELVLIAGALMTFSPLVGFALVFALVHSRGRPANACRRSVCRHACVSRSLRADAAGRSSSVRVAGGSVR